MYYDVHSLFSSHVWHQPVPHNTTHNKDSPRPHPTPPLHPSAMTLIPSKSSDESSINSISPKEELPDFADIAHIQNRASHQVGLESTEARFFNEFFRINVRVLKILWQLVVCNKLQSRGWCPEHLLWKMLYFMKVYRKQGPGCSVVGASAGAIDPKTHRKWVWAFIKAITKLVDVVVSNTTM